MKRRYVKRKLSRSDLALRVCKKIGLSTIHSRSDYLSRSDWMELLITIEQYEEKINQLQRQINNESDLSRVI